MAQVTNTTGSLPLAFPGTKRFVLKLGSKIYTMYTTNIKTNFRLKHQKSISSSFKVRHCKGVLHSNCSAELDSPGIPRRTRDFSQQSKDSMGHAGVLQHALLIHAQPASPAHFNWHTVLSSLLLIKEITSVPHCINCEQPQRSSPSVHQLHLLQAREKNYNSKFYCQQRNNNSFQRSQCFSSALIVLLTKYAARLCSRALPNALSHISNPTNKSFISNTLKTDSKHCFSVVALH